MATNTPPGSPVPTLGDAPNVPADMLKLATYLDKVTIPSFTSEITANAAFPTPVNGQRVNIAGSIRTWQTSAWVGDSRLVGSGTFFNNSLQPVDSSIYWNVCNVSPAPVLSNFAGVVLLDALVTVWLPTGNAGGRLQLTWGWNMVQQVNWHTQSKTGPFAVSIHTMAVNQPAGVTAGCFLSMQTDSSGNNVTAMNAYYSWRALA